MMFGRKDKKLSEYQNALVEQHYAEIENIYRTMRGWRHDWHNHIQALSAQLDSGEYEKARSYLNEINQSILSIDTVLKTGNTMADAILNSKISLMKSKQIEVEAEAQVPASLRESSGQCDGGMLQTGARKPFRAYLHSCKGRHALYVIY